MSADSPLARRYRSSALLFMAVAVIALTACWVVGGSLPCFVVGVGYAAIGGVFWVLRGREHARAAAARSTRPPGGADDLA